MMKQKTLDEWNADFPFWDMNKAGKDTLLIKSKDVIRFLRAIQYMIRRKFGSNIKYLDLILEQTEDEYNINQKRRKDEKDNP